MKITKIEISNIKYYIAERERLIREIDKYCSELSTGYKSQDFTNLRTSKGRGSQEESTLKLIWHNARIQKEIKKRIKRIERVIIRLYRIIDKISGNEIKTIVELRAIQGLTWEQIGEEMHRDPSNIRKKYVKFIEE